MGCILYFDDNNLYIFGGSDNNTLDDIIKYDLKTNIWKNHKFGGKKPEKTEFFSFCLLDKDLFVIGGR